MKVSFAKEFAATVFLTVVCAIVGIATLIGGRAAFDLLHGGM